MKRLLFAILLLMLISCQQTDYYEIGDRYFIDEQYKIAIENYRRVLPGDENYDSALIKIGFCKKEIEKIDSISQVKSDSLVKLSLVKQREKNLETYKAAISNLTNYIVPYRNSVADLETEINQFKYYSSLSKEALASEDEEFIDLGIKIQKLLVKVQVNEFPKIRKAYGSISSQKLWENDIEVAVKGNRNKTIEYVAGIFAANKNKKDFQEGLYSIFLKLRFTRINYKWYQYDDTYTYYSIQSPDDSNVESYN